MTDAQMLKLIASLLLLPALLCANPLAAAPWAAPVSTIPVARDRAFSGTLKVDVDASDTAQRIVRVKQRVPVQAAGRLTLLYPEWDAGSHGPTIEVQRLAGLVIQGGGRRLAWRRDPLDAHAFHVQVPKGVRELEVDFQFLAPLGPRSPISADLINLQWQHVILYPAGWFASRIQVAASLTLPQGLTPGTSLVERGRTGSTIAFAPVALDLLLDSPVLAAPHVQRRRLVDGQVPVRVTYFAEIGRAHV